MLIFDDATYWLNLARLAILLFTSLIAWLTYRSHLLLKEIQPDFNVLLSLPESIARIVMVGICLFLAWMSGLTAMELGLTIANPWWGVGLGLGIGVIIQLAVNLTTLHLVKYLGRDIYSPWLIRNILPRQQREWMLIALAFIPPVAMEELLFRTLLISTFRPIIPLPLLIIGTSIVFGLMHQPQGKLGMTVAAIINILFCILFIETGSLLVTFVAHYTVNLLQIIVGYHQRAWLESY